MGEQSTGNPIRTILVDAEGGTGRPRLELAARLAQRLEARLIGLSVGQLRAFYPGDDMGATLPSLIEVDREAIDADIAAARTAFEVIVAKFAIEHEWRSDVAPTTETFARHARAADLVVLGSPASGAGDDLRRPALGDLLMQAGRPLLVVPAGLAELSLKRVLVAWRDGHEARRALADAIGILQLAERVTVLTVCADEDAKADAEAAIEDVRAYLSHHGIAAHPAVRIGYPEDLILEEARAHDLTVAGAYGHSRLREWVFGGVTRNLLFYEPTCALLSR